MSSDLQVDVATHVAARRYNTLVEVEAFCGAQTCHISLRAGRTAGRGARLVSRVTFARSSAPPSSEVPHRSHTFTPVDTGVCAIQSEVLPKPSAVVQVVSNSYEQGVAIQRHAAQQKAKAFTLGVASPQLVGCLVWAAMLVQRYTRPSLYLPTSPMPPASVLNQKMSSTFDSWRP